MKSKISTLALILVLAFGLSFPGTTLAAQQGSIFSSFFKALQEKISSFQMRMERLRDKIEQEEKGTSPTFTEYLYEGSEGDEVERLQEFLSEYPDIYPEGEITGYFGKDTKNAVMRFQREYGIPTVGYVGPETRSKLNELILNKQSTTTVPERESDVREPEPEVELNKGVSEVESSSQFVNSHSIDSRPDYSQEVIEQEIQNTVNEARIAADLAPVSWSEEIAAVAREHSEEQAQDSRELVDSKKPCAFPILRHAGFESGLSVGDRLENAGIDYQRTGENLVLFPVSNDMVYRYNISEGKPAPCPAVSAIDFSQAETAQEKSDLLREEILKRKQYLAETPTVEWINKEWKDLESITDQAVSMWLESEGHKKNMLNAHFEKGGVGVAFAGDYIIITHVLVQD